MAAPPKPHTASSSTQDSRPDWRKTNPDYQPADGVKFGSIATKSGKVPAFEIDGGRLADIIHNLKRDGFIND